MASFPGSVKSFTSKNSGDVIQAAHVNDLQDEVNAIEAGYINGTAPLNSSNSTVAALSVSGASTFAVRPVMPPPDLAVVYLDSTVTIGSSAASTVAWLAQQIAINSSIHSTTTNPERLTPQSTGVYYFQAGLRFGLMASTGSVQLNIRDSSASEIGRTLYGASSQAQILQVSGYKRFDVTGGYGVCVLGMTGQSTMSLSSGAGESWFSMRKL